MKRSVSYEFRRRTHPSEDVSSIHRQLIETLDKSDLSVWKPGLVPLRIELGDSLECQVDLSSALAHPISGYAAYVFRSSKYTGTSAEFDDRVILKISASEEQCHCLTSEIMVGFVIAFEAYRAAALVDRDLAVSDWQAAVEKGRETGRDCDGRDGIMRFWPNCFYDEALLRKAVGIPADVCVERLKRAGINVRMVLDGIMLDSTAPIFERSELLKHDLEVRRALATGDPCLL